MSLTRKLQKSEQKNGVAKSYNIIITPELAIQLDQFIDKNIPGHYARLFAEFLKICPREEVKNKQNDNHT